MNDNDELYPNYDQPGDLDPLIDQEEDYIHGRPLLTWTGPSDLPEEANRRWFMLMITASFVLIGISLIIKRYILSIILIGIAWLTYMLSKLPSRDIEHAVTTTGFFSQDKFYPWSDLNSFWIIKDHGHYVLGLDTNRRLFASVVILLGAQNPIEVKEVISQYLPLRENHGKDMINQLFEKSSHYLEHFVDAGKAKFQVLKQRQSQQSKDRQINAMKTARTAADASSAESAKSAKANIRPVIAKDEAEIDSPDSK